MLTCILFSSQFGAAEAADAPGFEALPATNELPDPFRMNDGSRAATPQDWAKRRDEIVAILLHYEYGHMPPAPNNIQAEETSSTTVFDGKATEKRVQLSFGPDRKARMQVGIFIPNGDRKRFPVVLAIEPVWMDHLQPVARKAIERGYVFAGYERHDLDKDDADRSDGVHPLYPDWDWATLAVWAWGSMRVVDYLLTLDCVDPARIAITGHSRAGKTALLAGALDQRIALVAPHASGAGGAGSFRISGEACETLAAITDPKRFHHWFHPRLAQFAGKENRLPFDQHFLKALVAPRALLSLEALDDLWANPLGTQQTYLAAQPVFDFLGAGDKNVFYFRAGGHDTTPEDWDALLEFADHCFFGKPTSYDFHCLPFPDATKAFTWRTPRKQ